MINTTGFRVGGPSGVRKKPEWERKCAISSVLGGEKDEVEKRSIK